MVRMATQNLPPVNLETAPTEWAGEMRYVARQPILNLSGRLHAYELLFREGPDVLSGGSCDNSIGPLLDETVIFGLERFTNGFPAFVQCTAEVLKRELVRVLPPNLTVLAIPESMDLTSDLVDTRSKLKSFGFRFALDDFTGGIHPLDGLADYIRVDFSSPTRVRPEQLRQRLDTDPVTMVAKRVATQEDYRRACGEGFALFQGDYLFRPALLTNRKLPANRLAHFEILQNLYRDPVNLKRLSQLVMQEASLTYRLLRLVNSPVCAIRQEVRSIESALIIVGLDTFRRFATLAILCEANSDEHHEILRTALLRGRFCELGARMCRLDPAEQYPLGLFSLLPAMLRLPMEDLTQTLPLRDEIRRALEGFENHERCLLGWLEHHERGDWASCDAVVEANRLNQEKLIRRYGDALIWAETALRSAVTS
jgi:c-di-GMP phosphodiesterase